LNNQYILPNINTNKYQNIGKFSINLLKAKEVSAYKLLFIKDDFTSVSKTIRNNTLKKLAEANDNYFPKELQNDKHKKKVELTYEGIN
jgi:hypothetical protein